MENMIRINNIMGNVTDEFIDAMPTESEIKSVIKENNLNNITRFEVFGDTIIIYNKMMDTFVARLYKGKFFAQHENEPQQKKNRKVKNKIHTHSQRTFSNVYQLLDSANSHKTHLLSIINSSFAM